MAKAASSSWSSATRVRRSIYVIFDPALRAPSIFPFISSVLFLCESANIMTAQGECFDRIFIRENLYYESVLTLLVVSFSTEKAVLFAECRRQGIWKMSCLCCRYILQARFFLRGCSYVIVVIKTIMNTVYVNVILHYCIRYLIRHCS